MKKLIGSIHYEITAADSYLENVTHREFLAEMMICTKQNWLWRPIVYLFNILETKFQIYTS